MPPFRSRRPSSFQVPLAPHPSPEDHPSPSPPLPSARTLATASTASGPASSSSSTRPRSCIIPPTHHRTRSRSNTTSKPRSPTSPRRTRASASRTAEGYPTPPDSPRSNQPSSAILPDSLHPTSRHSRSSLSMSLFNSALNFLAGKLDVELENGGIVDMLGGPNTGTSYSLPGNVIISVPTLPIQMEGRSREIKDLSVVVEGKSEFFNDEEGRYTPMRIWTTTIKLASTRKPLLIPHVRSMQHRTELAVTFDLNLPGWLPPSHLSAMTQTSYGIVCSAVIGWVEPPPAITASISPLIDDFDLDLDGPARNTRSAARASARAASRRSAFDTSLSMFAIHSLNPQTTTKCQSTYKDFQVRRHRMPKALSLTGGPTEPTLRHYTLTPENGMPAPVECVVSVPDWVDLNCGERSLKISMRVRAKVPPQAKQLPPVPQITDDPMDGSSTAGPSTRANTVTAAVSSLLRQASKPDPKAEKVEDEVITRMMELAMEVEETERWTSNVGQAFTQAYPISTQQPSNRGTGGYPLLHPREGARNDCADDKVFRATRVRSCLLADDGSQRNFYFLDGGLALGEKWRKVNVVLPMPIETEKQRFNKPQAEADGPFYRVRHVLKIKVVCRPANAKPEDKGEPCTMSTPIRFATTPATMSNASTGPSLPAYIQLFHENGDMRECDPLPLYTPSAEDPIPPCPVSVPAVPFTKASGSSPPTTSPPTTAAPFRPRPVLPPIETAPRRSRLGMLRSLRDTSSDVPEPEEPVYREASIDSRGSTPEPSDTESEGSTSDSRAVTRAPPPSPESSLSSTRTRASRSAAPPPPATPRTPGGRKVVRRNFFVAT